jgi:hypothetical protein
MKTKTINQSIFGAITMNNRKVMNMINQLQDLDSYTQLSVLGSWNFVINAAVINAAQRYVPELPEEASGIDPYSDYEAMQRQLSKDAVNSTLPGLLNLQREIVSAIYNADGQPRGLEDTLQFLADQLPTRKQFEEEYEQRRRQGMRPQMSKKTFVDYEYERARNQHNSLIAKGEQAVMFCDNVTLADGELPEWVEESLEQKLIDKLHARWEKLEFVRTNPRRRKQIRDSADADQTMIKLLLAKYGEEPGFADTGDDAYEIISQEIEAEAPVKIWSKEEIKKINDAINNV